MSTDLLAFKEWLIPSLDCCLPSDTGRAGMDHPLLWILGKLRPGGRK